MIGAEKRDYEYVADAFETRQGSPYRTPEVMYLVAKGQLSYETSGWGAGEVTDAVLDKNPQTGPGTGTESPVHVQYKIGMARFFEESGYDVPKATGGAEPTYDCFEQNAGGLNSDVVVESDGGVVAGEVGYTPAKYLLRAFGYASVAPPGDVEAIDNGGLYRSSPSDVQIFVTRPYSSDKFHIFRAVDLPEPSHARLADAVDEITD